MILSLFHNTLKAKNSLAFSSSHLQCWKKQTSSLLTNTYADTAAVASPQLQQLVEWTPLRDGEPRLGAPEETARVLSQHAG